jgi:hypothetical protein
MEKFAGYGFNKSHAAAYSLVAYPHGWLKQHHPAAFAAATLSSEMANTDKVQFFWKDAIDNGLVFLPPDINQPAASASARWTRKTIRYGLGAIKGTGEAALSVILKAREMGGPFTDLFDFCRRIDKRVVNRRVIEALIRAGAFDAIDDHRAKLLASAGVALEAAEQAERNAMQGGLFDMGGGAQEDTAHYVEVPRWSEREQLMNEKPALGFFFSGHPYHAYAAELASFVKRRLGQLEAAARAGAAGRRGDVHPHPDDPPRQDGRGPARRRHHAARNHRVQRAVGSRAGQDQGRRTAAGRRQGAARRLQRRPAHFRRQAATPWPRRAAAMRAACSLTMNGGSDAKRLQALLAPFRNGPCPVRLSYRNGDATAELPLPESWRVRLDDALLAGLADWLKPENVKVMYSMITLIDDALLDAVCAEAAASPRRRKNRNFHPRDDHPGHRLLNAMQPDSYIPPHRHLDPNKDETFVVLRGSIGVVIFDDDREGGADRESRRRRGGDRHRRRPRHVAYRSGFGRQHRFPRSQGRPLPPIYRSRARALGAGREHTRGRRLPCTAETDVHQIAHLSIAAPQRVWTEIRSIHQVV